MSSVPAASRPPSHPSARPLVELLAARPGAKAHAAGHGGHGHDGGMTAVVLDLDEVAALGASQASKSLAPVTDGLAHRGAGAANRVFGPRTVSPGQATRAGAAMAQTGGLAIFGLGIYYAYSAAHHARHDGKKLGAEHAVWKGLTAASAAKVPGAPAGEPVLARQLRARGLAETSVQRLVAAAKQRQFAAKGGSLVRALASVAAAAMAATLVFSPDFLVSKLVPALAPLSGLALGIAIPAMVVYGLWNAASSAVAVVRGLRDLAQLRKHAAKLPDAERLLLEPHLRRTSRALVYEGLSGMGGILLGAGLMLQLTNPLVGVGMLALGSLGLELFASLRTQAQGVWLPESLTQDAEPALARSPATGLRALGELRRAEIAIKASRPSRLGVLTGLTFACTAEGRPDALRERTTQLLGALGWPEAGAAARKGDDAAAMAVLADALDKLELDDAWLDRLNHGGKRAAPWLMGVPADATRAQRTAALRKGLAQASGRSEAERSALYRSGLETLWGPGLDQLLVRYGQTRAITFHRLLAGERLS